MRRFSPCSAPQDEPFYYAHYMIISCRSLLALKLAYLATRTFIIIAPLSRLRAAPTSCANSCMPLTEPLLASATTNDQQVNFSLLCHRPPRKVPSCGFGGESSPKAMPVERAGSFDFCPPGQVIWRRADVGISHYFKNLLIVPPSLTTPGRCSTTRLPIRLSLKDLRRRRVHGVRRGR